MSAQDDVVEELIKKVAVPFDSFRYPELLFYVLSFYPP